jgi:Flp pilus assembly protein TadD
MSKHVPLPLRSSAWSHPFRTEADADDQGCWLRDLGLVYESAGDVLVAEGHLGQAAEKYQAALGIFERLAVNDPAAARTRSKLAPLG